MEIIERFLNHKPEFTFFVQRMGRSDAYYREFWADSDYIPPCASLVR